MKRFILITVGFDKPTPKIMEAWMQWFHSIEDNMVEQVGLMNGVEVTKSGIQDIPFDRKAITGYVVIDVENKDKAIEIAKKCPMITSTLVYEVRSNENK